jgi:hypothetical protein
MVLLNYSMVTAISMTKQPSPNHSLHFIYTHHRLWQALESNLSNDRHHGDPNPIRRRRDMLFSLDQTSRPSHIQLQHAILDVWV